MTDRLSSVLDTSTLPAVELQCARLDGEVFPLAEAYLAVDAPDTAEARGAALRAVMPPRVIAERRTAAWVWGALATAPLPGDFCADIETRRRPTSIAPHRLREVVLAADEVRNMGGMPVTSPLRTVLDLARGTPCDADDVLIERLTQECRLSLPTILGELARRHRLPGKKAAGLRLLTLLTPGEGSEARPSGPQPPLTR